MNKLYLIFLIIVIPLLQNCTSEEALPHTDTETFIKFKGDAAYALSAVDAKVLSGGVLLLANATDLVSEEVHPKLIKIDNNGVTEWETTLENINHPSYSLSILDENTYLIAGEDHDQIVPSISVLKVSQSGSFTQYVKVIDQTISRAKAVTINKNDNSIIVAGEITAGTNTIYPIVSNLNASDLSEITFFQDDGEKNYITNNVYQTLENGNTYIFISGKNPVTQKSQIMKIKLGEATAGSPTYPDTDNPLSVESFIADGSPYFGMASTSGNQLIFGYVSIDQQTVTEYIELKSSTTASSIHKHSDYFLVGGTYSGDASFGSSDFIIFMVDEKGNIISENIYGGKSTEVLKSTLTMPNGSILLYGHTLYGNVNTLLLVKTDVNGNL